MQETKDIKTNSNTQQESVEPGLFNAGSASSGAMLRAARKDRAMTLDQVSEELNLSHSIIDAIENDSWEHLPEATYVRGYIRSYARLLNLDPADVLMNFRYNNSEQNISLDSMPRRIEDREIAHAIPKKVKLLLFIAAVIGIVFYLYHQQQNQSGGVTQTKQTTTEAATATTGTATTNEADASESVANQLNQAESSASSLVKASSTDDNVGTADNVEQPASAAITEENKELLELEFSSTSWVDIRNKSGDKVIYKSFPPGDKVSVKATLPLSVFIGNTDAVSMRYQGQVIDLQKYKEEVYAKFTLGE